MLHQTYINTPRVWHKILEMALAVNVLPNEDKSPTDIYQKVADKVAEMWEKKNPFTSIGLKASEMKR